MTILDEITFILGANHRDCLITSREAVQSFVTEWRGRWHGEPLAVVMPKSIEQLCKIVRVCYQRQCAIVPQGGNTGLVGGQIPDDSGQQLIISMCHINAIRDASFDTGCVVVEAGVILSELQQYADKMGLFFPLSLASENSAQIGGLIATNAGGTAVLRYGNMRALVLGIEAVLPDGQLFRHLSPLYKDNSGYDLKQLFIGSEGSLGIITAACLKLFPKPVSSVTAWIAVDDLSNVMTIFRRLRSVFGNLLTGFELIPQIGVEFVCRHKKSCRLPSEKLTSWYILLEVSASFAQHHLDAIVEPVLMELLTATGKVAQDIVIAQDHGQELAFWELRSSMSECQKYEGISLKHDISLPLSVLPEFTRKAVAQMEKICSGIRPVVFGHIGDGNLHFNLSQPEHMDIIEYKKLAEELTDALHALVLSYGGSIAAEHGIGQMKAKLLKDVKDPVAYQMMCDVKQLLDPDNLMNPGKVLC